MNHKYYLNFSDGAIRQDLSTFKLSTDGVGTTQRSARIRTGIIEFTAQGNSHYTTASMRRRGFEPLS